MKRTITFFLFVFFVSWHSFCFGQIQPMGFTQKVITPESDRFQTYYRPKLQLINDTLYVSSNTGIYRKDLRQDLGWELHAFKDIAVIEFVKNGDNLIAISTGTKNGQDSLMFISNDNGKTFKNYTPQHLFEFEPYNYLHRIVQNPQNPNSILLFHSCYGLSKSEDFGNNWKNLNDVCGLQNWFAGFHPSDTTVIFYSGEMSFFAGYMYRWDDRTTWEPPYIHPGGDNCIHHIAFHPDDANILVYSGEGTIAKSVDKGKSWRGIDMSYSGMYFYKILFDEDNPNNLYASGLDRGSTKNDTIFVYRSTDTSESWHLAYKESLDTDCGGVYDMLKYHNKLIFYTRNSGLFELDVNTIPLSMHPIDNKPDVSIYPNPVRNTLYFNTETEIERIEMIDAMGRIVQKTIVSGKNTVDVSWLNKGVYFAVFYVNGQKIIKKLYII